ncbi:Protein kinase domain and Serine/threonine-/dual specificity protein kinase, catalytic domain and Protein kinase-like domain-containing protein [Strongyloides ratti]|uniref:Protein kinase domain and Serine/threonine-/dual specificity protein kinase, catalytic domain and Protein kinase-like domain-containing protein n=1 Tax=Strongyloides ratti TaxID=34506 RepID=A0A090MNE8_STRRB|nr:Protein kinase domain and Serine/threonine-/dual specificity protein kinase, catalytic domain and Protein kinase-like domain-containing protein [Strongyloides ratti]CEF59596.1 Protein kinase domain and Serine/threonine-/dual specificity protein kinase, catalytic domain and Protein kinase-like domain-containing protein [Strongyloides ratti]
MYDQRKLHRELNSEHIPIDKLQINNDEKKKEKKRNYSEIMKKSLTRNLSFQERRVSYSDEKNIYSNQIITLKNNLYSYLQSLDNCLGQGSYGRVFKGTSSNISLQYTNVAIKEMLSIYVNNNEMEIMKAVSSDFLVKLIDIYQDNNFYKTYLIMELCDSDLLQFLKANTILNENNLRTVIDNVVRGYHVLFKNKIVHRDIKPQNILIMIDKNNSQNIISSKITDFGISRIMEINEDGAEISQLTNVAGTFHYMAPEVGVNLLHVSMYNYPVDIWSMGCVFYECLMGKLPFDEKEICRLFLYAAGKNYEAYEKPSFSSNLYHDYQELISQMLEINDRDRITPTKLFEFIENTTTT